MFNTTSTRRTAVVVAALATAAMLSLPAPAQAGHQSHVTTNVTRNVDREQLYSMSTGYAKMAGYALSACSAPAGAAATAAAANLKYALRLTPFGRVSAGWTASLLYGFQRFTGQNFCDIALRASEGAAWSAYYGYVGGTQTRLYIYQEDRHWSPDVCHTYQSFGGVWRMSGLRTMAGGGCPRV